MRPRITAAITAGAVLLLTVACTGSATSPKSTSLSDAAATTSPVTTSGSGSPTGTASSIAALPTPDPNPGTRDLLLAEGTGSSPKSWEIEVKPGIVWAAVNCRGDGKLLLKLSPVATLTIMCAAGSMTPSLNEINLQTPRTWRVTLEGPASVRWSMRLRQ